MLFSLEHKEVHVYYAIPKFHRLIDEFYLFHVFLHNVLVFQRAFLSHYTLVFLVRGPRAVQIETRVFHFASCRFVTWLHQLLLVRSYECLWVEFFHSSTSAQVELDYTFYHHEYWVHLSKYHPFEA